MYLHTALLFRSYRGFSELFSSACCGCNELSSLQGAPLSILDLLPCSLLSSRCLSFCRCSHVTRDHC